MAKKTKSLLEQEMGKPSFAKKFNEAEKRFELEYQIEMLMELLGMTQKDLALALDKDKSVVSKDLNGAIKKAGILKINKLAEALGAEFIPLLVPKKKAKKLKEKLIAEKLLA